MEGSNYWGYGYKTQHSYPKSRLITWRRPEVKFVRNVMKKKQHKNYYDEDKKSAINKKLILTCILFDSHSDQSFLLSVQGHAIGILLGLVPLQKGIVICIVRVSNIFGNKYHLSLTVFNVKPFSFMRSMDVWSSLSSQSINECNGNVSPFKTLATMSKKHMSPSGEWTITFVFLQGTIIEIRISLGRPYASSVCSIFSLA